MLSGEKFLCFFIDIPSLYQGTMCTSNCLERITNNLHEYNIRWRYSHIGTILPLVSAINSDPRGVHIGK